MGDTKIIINEYYLQGLDGPTLTAHVETDRSWSPASVLGVLCLCDLGQMEEECFSCLDRIEMAK